MIKQKITKKKIEKYYLLSSKALKLAKESQNKTTLENERKDIINMIECYLNDAMFFYKEKKDYINAFAALNYAHGWLDCAARLKIFDVHDSRLFTVDDKDEKNNSP